MLATSTVAALFMLLVSILVGRDSQRGRQDVPHVDPALAEVSPSALVEGDTWTLSSYRYGLPMHYELHPYCSPAEGRRVVVPELVERFDWVFISEEAGPLNRRAVSDGKDVRTVYAAPEALGRLLHSIDNQNPPFLSIHGSASARVLALGGSEVPLSAALGGDNQTLRGARLAALRRHFGTVLYYSKDEDIDGILALPVGIGYASSLSHARLHDALRAMARAPKMLRSGAKRGALAARHQLLDPVVEKANEARECFGPGFFSVATHAIESLTSLYAWTGTEEAHNVGVTVQQVPSDVWWSELATYRFVLVPIGTAITRSVIFEALLVLTVPVVQRGPFSVHDDLMRMGFPLSVVNVWESINAEALDSTWRELSPRLERFRSRCLSQEGFWVLVTEPASWPCV